MYIDTSTPYKTPTSISRSNTDESIISTTVNHNNENLLKEQYDFLVLAMGSQPRKSICPGANEHAIPFYSSDDAFKLRTVLQHQKESILASKKQFVHVVIVGASYIGIEVACNVAEYIGTKNVIITIIERSDKIMPTTTE